jgi:hypothetical protein
MIKLFLIFILFIYILSDPINCGTGMQVLEEDLDSNTPFQQMIDCISKPICIFPCSCNQKVEFLVPKSILVSYSKVCGFGSDVSSVKKQMSDQVMVFITDGMRYMKTGQMVPNYVYPPLMFFAQSIPRFCDIKG